MPVLKEWAIMFAAAFCMFLIIEACIYWSLWIDMHDKK